MHTRSALDRLSAAGGPLLAEASSLVDSAEEERILTRIMASERPFARRRRPNAVVLAAAAVIVAAIAALALRSQTSSIATSGGHHRHHIHLTGVSIELAGYQFKTPAGFRAATGNTCWISGPARPGIPFGSLAEAAGADGGCIEALFVTSHEGTPVDMGSYRGYYVPPDASGRSALYVGMSTADPGAWGPQYLALFSEGLTESQLIAVAESGLPSPN